MTTLTVTRSASGIATVMLNRPDSRNAYNATMAHELDAAFAACDADPLVRVVVLAGRGTHFCVGADLGSDASQREHRDLGGVASLSIYHCAKPVIAAIHGAAVGIGITLVLPCDLRVAEEDTIVGFLFALRGLSVEAASSYFLPRLVGMSRALEWCLTARKFPAREAAGTGLFSHIVPKGQALTTAMNLAEAMIANSSHQSLVFIKRSLWSAQGHATPHQAHHLESLLLNKCFSSPDVVETQWTTHSLTHAFSFASFLGKRPAKFPVTPADVNMDELNSESQWPHRFPLKSKL